MTAWPIVIGTVILLSIQIVAILMAAKRKPPTRNSHMKCVAV